MAERRGGAWEEPRRTGYDEPRGYGREDYDREGAFDRQRGRDRDQGADYRADEPLRRDPRRLVAYEDDRAGDHYRPERRRASPYYERADDPRDAGSSTRRPPDRSGYDHYASSWRPERREDEDRSFARCGREQGYGHAEEHNDGVFRPESSRAQHYRPHEHDWPHTGHAEAAREPFAARAPARPRAGAQMRLVALASDVLPHGQRIAIVDSRDEGVSIGRDRAFSARIRLPAMSVSKHHANLFFLGDNSYSDDVAWGVTDAGSVHGTFHLAAASAPDPDDAAKVSSKRFTRLSDAKKASAPKQLAHGDWLRCGATTFEVHIHGGAGALACQRCALSADGSNEIVLSAEAEAGQAATASRATAATAGVSLGAGAASASQAPTPASASQPRAQIDRKIETEAVRRARMREMREMYLGGGAEDDAKTADAGDGTEDTHGKPAYIDRAAERRAKHPREPGPKRWNRRRSASPRAEQSKPAARATPARAPPQPEPARAVPLGANNRGFRMFAMMQQGGASDAASAAAVAPAAPNLASSASAVVARGTEGRAGLGSVRLRDAEEIGAASMGAAWAQEGASAGAGYYNSKDAVRRRYEQSLATKHGG